MRIVCAQTVSGPKQSDATAKIKNVGAIAGRACYAGEHTDEVLREIGCDAGEIARLRTGGAVA